MIENINKSSPTAEAARVEAHLTVHSFEMSSKVNVCKQDNFMENVWSNVYGKCKIFKNHRLRIIRKPICITLTLTLTLTWDKVKCKYPCKYRKLLSERDWNWRE